MVVITAIVLVITASRLFTAAPHHLTAGRPVDAQPAQQRSAVGEQRGASGSARPAPPVMVTIESPQGQQILSAPVDPLSASRNTDGSWAPIDPPSTSRAVWMSQSALPAAPSTGTTAIYGHACIGFTCVFNDAVKTPVGSTVIVETDRTVLRYRVSSVTQYPKTGAQSLASRASTANELILVTCAYRPDDSSVNNLVVNANLVTADNK
jgi:LPXTG-site transpeptidase (sortase) family protein